MTDERSEAFEEALNEFEKVVSDVSWGYRPVQDATKAKERILALLSAPPVEAVQQEPTPVQRLASFAHEVVLGAYEYEQLPDAAMRALRDAGYPTLESVLAQLTPVPQEPSDKWINQVLEAASIPEPPEDWEDYDLHVARAIIAALARRDRAALAQPAGGAPSDFDQKLAEAMKHPGVAAVTRMWCYVHGGFAGSAGGRCICGRPAHPTESAEGDAQ